MPKSKYGEKVLKQAKEKVTVERRLRRKYPQMYKEGWGKKKNWAQKLKGKVKSAFKSTRTKATEKGMKKGGLTKQEIARFGKK